MGGGVGLGQLVELPPPPPFVTPELPCAKLLCLTSPPVYATSNPSIPRPPYPPPPLWPNFVDALGYTVHRDILLP